MIINSTALHQQQAQHHRIWGLLPTPLLLMSKWEDFFSRFANSKSKQKFHETLGFMRMLMRKGTGAVQENTYPMVCGSCVGGLQGLVNIICTKHNHQIINIFYSIVFSDDHMYVYTKEMEMDSLVPYCSCIQSHLHTACTPIYCHFCILQLLYPVTPATFVSWHSCILPLLYPTTPVSCHSCIHSLSCRSCILPLLYPAAPVSGHSCILPFPYPANLVSCHSYILPPMYRTIPPPPLS